MFVLKREYTVWWPVEVSTPDEKATGRFVKWKFEALFTVSDRDAWKARNDLRKEIIEAEDTIGDIVERLEKFDDETYCEFITDWRGIFEDDAKKTEIPFSREMLLLALRQPMVKSAFDRAYAEISSGEHRRKN